MDDDQIRQVVDEGLRAYRLILENRSLAEVARKQHAELEQWNQSLEAQVAQRTEEVKARNLQTVSYTHLTLPTKRIV